MFPTRQHCVALALFAAALILCAPAKIWGQGSDLGTIRGAVTDFSGARIPGANVIITDKGTNAQRSVVSNALGEYEAAGLKSGTYSVTFSMQGFNTLEVGPAVLRPSETVRIDGRLEVSATNETVTVTAEPPMIQTDNPTVSGTLTNELVTELPRDSRDYFSFLYLNPNVTQAAGSGSFKFIGAQSYGASFSVDGQRTNGGVFGEPTASQPSLETIGELTVMSNNFTAEYAGVANIRVTTRRGTGQYHGSLFYDNKNSALAAWNLNDKNAKGSFSPTDAVPEYPFPYFNQNEFGGSFGGPIPKVKDTYFFAAYEKLFRNSPVFIRNTKLPHASLLAGDFTMIADSAKPAVPAGVTLTATEIAQNTVDGQGLVFTKIPQRLMNPIVGNFIQKYFPATSMSAPINKSNGRLVEYATNLPGTLRRDLGTLRIDHDFTESDRIYGVYNVQAVTSATSMVVSPFVPLGLTQNERKNHTLSISEIHMFTPTLINEARGGFNRVPNLRRSNNTMRQFLQNIGFEQSDIDAYGAVIGASTLDSFGHAAVNLGSTFQAFTNGGRNTYRPLDQNLITFGDTITWVTGKHAIKIGADWVRNAAVDGFTSGRGNPRGVMNYTGAGTAPLARFLMGLPANTVSYVNQFRPPMDVHNWEQGYFVQDDFKIHPKLTLNLGLRYEIITPFTENNDLLVNFDPRYVGQDGKKGRFVMPSSKTLQYIDPRFINYGVVTAAEAGVPRQLVRTDYGSIAPRIGAAWRVTEKTVLRGGYGLFYPTAAAQGIRDPLATNSFQVGLTKRTTPDAALSGWPGTVHGISPMTGGAINALSSTISANWVPFDLKQPRIHQYNITVEQEIGWQTGIRVSYLGTLMQRLISGWDANMLTPSDTPFATTIGDGVTPCTPDDGDCDYSDADRARLPYPNLGSYQIGFGNFGHGRSNALQLELNRRFAQGFTFNASYTYLDQKSTSPDTGNSSLGGTAYNQFDSSADYGMDAFTSHHRFITYGIVESPFGRGRRFGSDIHKALDAVVGGWQLSWQLFAKSGTPFTPFWICDNCDPIMPGNVGSGSLDATGGFYGTTMRPIVNGKTNVKSGDRLWNPSAFDLMPLGSDLFSNPNVAVRNLLSGPSTYGLNMGIRKIFRYRENVRIELGADANNILNHPLLSPDNYDIGVLGEYTMQVNPATLKPEIQSVDRNPDFGRLLSSYDQEGVDSRRAFRLRLRITF